MYFLLSNENALTDQYKISKKSFKTLRREIKKLKIPFSNRYNAMYGIDDFARVLVQMSKENQFPTSGAAALVQENVIKREENKTKAKLAGRKDDGAGEERQAIVDDETNVRIPTARWVLGKARSVDSRRVLAWSRSVIRRMAKVGRELGMVGSTSTAAIDITDIEYYGKGMVGRRRKSKPKNGTSRFVSYMVVHSVGSTYSISINSRPVKKKEKIPKLMRRMLKSIERSGIKLRLILADRGFYSVESINCLKEDGRRFLAPAVRNSRVVTAILEYCEGKRDAVSEFSIKNKDGIRAEFTLVIIEKENPVKSDNIEDRYVAFATNIPCNSSQDILDVMSDEYRARWVVETGFRVVKDVMGKTCSNSWPVRVLLFHVALLLYSLWKMAKLAHAMRYASSFTMDAYIRCIASQAKMVQYIFQRHKEYYMEAIK